MKTHEEVNCVAKDEEGLLVEITGRIKDTPVRTILFKEDGTGQWWGSWLWEKRDTKCSEERCLMLDEMLAKFLELKEKG